MRALFKFASEANEQAEARSEPLFFDWLVPDWTWGNEREDSNMTGVLVLVS